MDAIPDDSLIFHVSGNTTPHSYVDVGRAVAMEIFNSGVVRMPSDKVVDVGCGCGRIAQFIAPLLAPNAPFAGKYVGLDTWHDGITWARDNISSTTPQAEFIHVGSANGYDPSSLNCIPLGDGSQDAALAVSLFTHLRWEPARQYLAEIGRVLRKGGRAYLTFFASMERFREMWPNLVCDEDEYGLYFVKPEFEDAFVNQRCLEELFRNSGLAVLDLKHGAWRGEKFGGGRGFASYQDAYILERR
jgi:SAM-dependent methyltransferase